MIEVLTDTSGERDATPSVINLLEHSRPYTTQAYMLFYLKSDEIDPILQEPANSSIPRRIEWKFEEEN